MQNQSLESPAWTALSNELAGAVERAGRAVVGVNARHRFSSSGVHWRQGVIVTAEHTVRRDEDLTVTLSDGRTVPVQLAGRDAGTDLAALKLQDVDLPVAELGDLSSLKVGHLVLGLGRAGADGVSAGLGVIKVLGGPWRTWRGGVIDQSVRLDLTLYPSFSGGPLVDAHGRVLGINTSAFSRLTATAVPASTVDRVLTELVERGHIARGYLGVGMHPVRLPDTLRKSLNFSGKTGNIVLSVEAEGPAGKAGVLLGDVLVAMDGKPVEDTDDVQARLGSGSVGKKITVTIVRGGALKELAITVGERPRT